MVRITLAIPEDLRYRLKLAMMDHRRKSRSRITQDDYCAQAIAARLDLERQGLSPGGPEHPLAVFLRDCLGGQGLTKGWALKAKALLGGLAAASPEDPHQS